MGSIVEVMKAAAPYGGGIAVVLAIVAAASAAAQKSIGVRRAAVERAESADVPKLVGDEIDKLGISAAKLTQKQQYETVMVVLRQREARNKRIFALALVITILGVVVAILGLVVAPQQAAGGTSKPITTVAPSASAAAAGTANAPASLPPPCVGAIAGNITAEEAARVKVGTPCPKVENIKASGSSMVDIGSTHANP